MTLSKYQKDLLEYLRKGGYFESHVSGWTYPKYPRKTIRVETQHALEATGLTQTISKIGKYGTHYRIIYKPKE